MSVTAFIDDYSHHTRTYLEELDVLDNTEGLRHVIEFLFSIKQDVRFHLIKNETLLEELWDLVRKEEAVYDYVMDLISYIRLKHPDNLNQHFDSACLALSLYEADSVVDADTKERMLSDTEAKALLGDNLWLTHLVYLKYVPLSNVLPT